MEKVQRPLARGLAPARRPPCAGWAEWMPAPSVSWSAFGRRLLRTHSRRRRADARAAARLGAAQSAVECVQLVDRTIDRVEAAFQFFFGHRRLPTE